jgi:hypothetical protein
VHGCAHAFDTRDLHLPFSHVSSGFKHLIPSCLAQGPIINGGNDAPGEAPGEETLSPPATPPQSGTSTISTNASPGPDHFVSAPSTPADALEHTHVPPVPPEESERAMPLVEKAAREANGLQGLQACAMPSAQPLPHPSHAAPSINTHAGLARAETTLSEAAQTEVTTAFAGGESSGGQGTAAGEEKQESRERSREVVAAEGASGAGVGGAVAGDEASALFAAPAATTGGGSWGGAC